MKIEIQFHTHLKFYHGFGKENMLYSGLKISWENVILVCQAHEYFQVANRRVGRLLLSRIFSNTSPSELIRTPRLLIFKEIFSDQDNFTPDLLYLQYLLSKNAYLTPI